MALSFEGQNEKLAKRRFIASTSRDCSLEIEEKTSKVGERSNEEKNI